MPATTDPLQRVAKATETYQDHLQDLWKGGLKKLASELKPMIAFGANLIRQGKAIVGTIGASVMKTIETAYAAITRALKAIPDLVKAALDVGRKILALVAKAANPGKVAGALKKLFARYVALMKEIVSYVAWFVNELDVLGKALAVVEKFKSVLKFVASWIADVSGALGAVKKAKALLVKVQKTLKGALKEALTLQKDVAKLKAA